MSLIEKCYNEGYNAFLSSHGMDGFQSVSGAMAKCEYRQRTPEYISFEAGVIGAQDSTDTFSE